MITTTWTAAPAGVLGRRRDDVRPYPGVVVRPAAGRSRQHRLVLTPAVPAGACEPGAQRFVDGMFPQNDGTTLGIHPSGRPQS